MTMRGKTMAALFAALLCISSYVAIPLGPVPVTLQILILLLAGTVLGARLGLISVLLWLALGIVGLPVFAGGKAGPMVLVGPTGGYLLGYLCCVYCVGKLAGRRPVSYVRAGAAMILGLVSIYVCGLFGFMASFQYFLHKPMTLQQALSLAVYPFIPFDLGKAVIAALVTPTLQKALGQAGLSQNEKHG